MAALQLSFLRVTFSDNMEVEMAATTEPEIAAPATEAPIVEETPDQPAAPATEAAAGNPIRYGDHGDSPDHHLPPHNPTMRTLTHRMHTRFPLHPRS